MSRANAARRFLIVLVLSLAAHGCASDETMVSAEDFTYASVDGQASPVVEYRGRHKLQLFTSAFLPRGEDPSPGFAVYSFLLFIDRSPESYAQRRAAAEGFLCLFHDLKEAEAFGLEPARLAVLYAPVRPGQSLADVRRSRNPDDLLDVYDHLRADVLQDTFSETVGERVPELAIVGVVSDDPLGDLSRDEVMWTDLSGLSPENVRAAMVMFRDGFVSGGPSVMAAKAYRPREEAEGIVLAFARNFFESLGQLVTRLGSSAEASETPPASRGQCV